MTKLGKLIQADGKMMRLMNIKHKISSVGAARSNGFAENLVKKFAQLAKIYSDDDTEIEQAIPLMVMSLRATARVLHQMSRSSL